MSSLYSTTPLQVSRNSNQDSKILFQFLYAKVKLSVHDVKGQGGIGIELHTFPTSVPGKGERSAVISVVTVVNYSLLTASYQRRGSFIVPSRQRSRNLSTVSTQVIIPLHHVQT